MTRGRPPRQAIREARAIAEKLGVVIEGSGMKGSSAGLTVFCQHVTIFVHVRRSREHINGILDIADKYRVDIIRLRAIPLTGVVLRELWIRSPNGNWQYFRILDDGIMEIRNSGTFDRTPADFDCGSSNMSPDPEPVFTQDRSLVPASPYGEGFTCPFFEYMRGRLSP
ncbi:MAG: hypothetical protein NTZ37_00715 [Methanoregula sp.]|jgi:hypothetical protein|nr:hypothetical protein [Methanoregula sp.]